MKTIDHNAPTGAANTSSSENRKAV
jgi:hypothetical protein